MRLQQTKLFLRLGLLSAASALALGCAKFKEEVTVLGGSSDQSSLIPPARSSGISGYSGGNKTTVSTNHGYKLQGSIEWSSAASVTSGSNVKVIRSRASDPGFQP